VKCKTANNIGKHSVSYSSFKFVLFVDSTKFFCLFLCFQAPLISCASAWRAGETKNDVSLN
jgi:hypothetical protein